jgi:hypothetical protein
MEISMPYSEPGARTVPLLLRDGATRAMYGFMASYRFTIIALVLLWASPVNADIWCGYGPDSPTLDHSCSDDIDRLARAVANFKAERQWEKIPGVMEVGSGINIDHGFYVAIQVYVNPPSMIPSVVAQVPKSIDGVPILVVPPEVAVIGDASSTNCKSGWSNDPADSAYLPIEKQYSPEWMKLPGVLTMGPQCKDGCCDSTKLEVSVQGPLIDSVRNHIPASIDGVPILLVPFRK